MSRISEIITHKKYYGGISLEERMKECHTSAISIALIENYKICDTYVYGVKRRNRKEKITDSTIFQAASISKSIFAVAVMRLVERGIIDINKDISEYLIDYELPAHDNKEYRITLKQILSHRAGLNLRGFYGYRQGQKIPSIEQILNGESPSNNLKLKIHQDPEAGTAYSGGGYILAQKIVTDVCKKDFCDLMNEMVLLPLFMTHSTFSQPLPNDKLNEFAYGYDFQNMQLTRGYNVMPELSAAGLWSTPTDLARFGIEIMNILRDKSAFLKKSTAELLTTKAYKRSLYGIGFVADKCKKGSTFESFGMNIGYNSCMYFCPNDGTGIIIMQNSNICEDILDEVIGAFKDIYGW